MVQGLDRLVVAPDQRRQHVRTRGREVVARTVEVRRHGRDPRPLVLTPHRLDVQDAGDLGDRVGVVGGLEVPGEQRHLRVPRLGLVRLLVRQVVAELISTRPEA